MTSILRGQLLSLLAQTTDVQLRTVLHNPEVLLNPAVRAALPPSLVTGLREAVANALHGAFLVGFIIAHLALLSVFLPGVVFEMALDNDEITFAEVIFTVHGPFVE